jgi:hypothetical protein
LIRPLDQAEIAMPEERRSRISTRSETRPGRLVLGDGHGVDARRLGGSTLRSDPAVLLLQPDTTADLDGERVHLTRVDLPAFDYAAAIAIGDEARTADLEARVGMRQAGGK